MPYKGCEKIINTDLLEIQIASMVNRERAKAGLPPLTPDYNLSGIARLKSGDMRLHNYCGHQSPVYGSPFDMLVKFGVDYRHAGENVAMGYGTREAVMNGWMESPGHRNNILNDDYKKIGVGVVTDSYRTVYWTQLFVA